MGLHPTTTPRPAFGRRTAPQARLAPAARTTRFVAPAPVPSSPPAIDAINTPDGVSVDQELQAWKEARGSQFKMPWSQLSLMASLCFGIASFVLPDSVNDNVDYLLWALSAVAATVWWTNRKKKAEIKAPAAP